MQTRSKRWIVLLLVCIALSVAWFVWHPLHTVTPLDVRAEASRSDAVVYGSVREESGRRHVVVEEIWKFSSTEAELRVGSAIPVPQLPRDTHPERLVVFLERSSRDGRLHASTIVAVYHGRLGWPEMSIEEAKAMCAGTHASNLIGQDKGKAVPRDTRFTRVWVKQQGSWRLVANHYSSRITQQ
jgi:hypothetical protein